MLATTETVATLKPYARILGTRKLMPNVKVGTLVSADKLK